MKVRFTFFHPIATKQRELENRTNEKRTRDKSNKIFLCSGQLGLVEQPQPMIG